MQLPKSVTIGKKKWHIAHTQMRNGHTRGSCYPNMGFIEVNSNDSYVFWHELTHAILHDMGADWQDEEFVVAFSERLDQAIKTARF